MGKLVSERRRETEKERERETDREREGGAKQMCQNCIPTMNMNSRLVLGQGDSKKNRGEFLSQR